MEGVWGRPKNWYGCGADVKYEKSMPSGIFVDEIRTAVAASNVDATKFLGMVLRLYSSQPGRTISLYQTRTLTKAKLDVRGRDLDKRTGHCHMRQSAMEIVVLAGGERVAPSKGRRRFEGKVRSERRSSSVNESSADNAFLRGWRYVPRRVTLPC